MTKEKTELPGLPQAPEEEAPWTIKELKDIINQGQQAHEALTKDIAEKITNLSNIAFKVGRYKQVLSEVEKAEQAEASDDATQLH